MRNLYKEWGAQPVPHALKRTSFPSQCSLSFPCKDCSLLFRYTPAATWAPFYRTIWAVLKTCQKTCRRRSPLLKQHGRARTPIATRQRSLAPGASIYCNIPRFPFRSGGVWDRNIYAVERRLPRQDSGAPQSRARAEAADSFRYTDFSSSSFTTSISGATAYLSPIFPSASAHAKRTL